MTRLSSATELQRLRQKIIGERDPNKTGISICCGTGCRAYGSAEVADGFRAELKNQNLSEEVDLKQTGCHGFCERGPVIVIRPEETFYQHVGRDDVAEIIEKTIVNGEFVPKFQYLDRASRQQIQRESDLPFYKWQQRFVFTNNGLVDPTQIEDYLAVGGYSALADVLFNKQPHDVIEEIKTAGLRGRGGAGFPTGVKWELLANQKNGSEKYLVCNGDEGDPGAYMDRSVLEGNPQSVIEGMLIGAYATGATHGLVYVRAEYPLAVKHLYIALDQARDLGLLGENILGSNFSFDIRVVKGAGAFVCGEETAMIHSVEGQRSVPRTRPPFPVERGIDGQPTAINNVETWANVPIIIREGAENFASIGTEKSPGTKIFSLVGKIKNTGLVEVPMGITIRDIVEKIGGGASKPAEIKAVQTGGPSGGCIPAEQFDLTIDYDSLSAAGSMMGSGGLIVMDARTCMVDVAQYFLSFTSEESCGKCVPCRIGIPQMVDILDKITSGNGEPGDIEQLEWLATVVKNGSLCGLGQTAPNPVLTTLRYFREEFEAHVFEKCCPASVCRDLVEFQVISEKCNGCHQCVKVCPTGAFIGERKQPHSIDTVKCIKCGECFEICKFDAITGNGVLVE